jgi:exodeoxyribonuclease-3
MFMRLISWNVNGLRSVISKEMFTKFIEASTPDCVCLQETKTRDKVPVDLPGYEEFWNHAKKAGYAGTAIFTRVKPENVTYGMGIAKHDEEGRVITLEFKDFYLVNVYVPNSKRDLSRLGYRQKEWDVDFLKYLKKLEKKKPVIFCGDLNVAHTEIDLTYPKANVQNHGFTPEERQGFDSFVKAGFIDTFREFEKDKGYYTWWSKFNNCRERNIGWRIDYFLISKALRPRLKKAFILKGVLGSDHCPVGIEIS